MFNSKSLFVRGVIKNSNGDGMKNQAVIALTFDLHAASLCSTAKTVSDILAHKGFELLRKGFSGPQGNFTLEFYDCQLGKAGRKKAGVIVFAISNAGEIAGRSRLINPAELAEKTEVRNIDIRTTSVEKRTEYSVVMNKLTAFLKSGNVSLGELAGSPAQVKVTSAGSDLPAAFIQNAVAAESLRSLRIESKLFNAGNLSHELLFAVGSQNVELNWLVLFCKTDNDLKSAIGAAVEANLIGKHDEKEISAFLAAIHDCSSVYALSCKGKNQAFSLG